MTTTNLSTDDASLTGIKLKSILCIAIVALVSCQQDDARINDDLVAFDPDGRLEADIRWTTYGVPHITADNLQSLAFGNAYAYARDNYCTLAEQIVKVKSERSKYFGPDLKPGSGDAANIVSDFGYKSLRLIESAYEKYSTFSDNSRALLEGYSQGFNQYLADTGAENLAPQCAGAEWVQPITPQQLAAYYASVNMLKSSAQPAVMELSFYANPGDGQEFLPYPSPDRISAPQIKFEKNTLTLPTSGTGDMGSNGWALGGAMTPNGNGAMLGNPHFPIVGNLRFWQSHLTIPGVMNVMGGSLQGYPFVQMGFNDNIAWTHTVSNSEHFVLYRLALEGDRFTYLVDDAPHHIEQHTYSIEVRTGDGETTQYFKDYYYSHHGLLIEMPPEANLLGWTDSEAFTLRDAASERWDSLDHWLAINLADDLQGFQRAFRDHDGITFVNALYADHEGNSFYINNSSVLNFDQAALDLMRSDPEIAATHDLLELYILPGDTSMFEPDGINDYEQSPKLDRSDFVQNCNDSYWATNPEQPLTGYSALYGGELTPLSLRTRLSLKMLDDSAGEDGKFDVHEMEAALLSNRSYLAELVLGDLLAQCNERADTVVVLETGQEVDIREACMALARWDGTMNTGSIAAHVFREFAYKFDIVTQLTQPFDPENPVNTPHTLSADASVLQSFAAAVANLNRAGVGHDEEFGNVQFFEKTTPDGSGSGVKMPWPGPNELEGGFNIQSVAFLGDTRLPVHRYEPVVDVETSSPMASGLSEQGYSVTFSSSWVFAVSFTDEGPNGRGILMNSQSSDSRSPHFDDQSRHYSRTNSLRPLYFSDLDISINMIESLNIQSTK